MTKHALYQYSLDILTRPLLDYRNDGFDLKTNNGKLWYFPFISEMLGDLLKNVAVTLTYNSNIHAMKDYVDRGIANQYSLHNMKNIFWKHP